MIFTALLFLGLAARAEPLPAPAVPAIQAGLQETLKLYRAGDMYPADEADGSTKAYFDWQNCFESKFARSPVHQEEGTLAPACRPDTVYTWQTERGFASFRQAATGSRWASKFPHGGVFTHLNPASTFAYGSEALRIKLRADLNFKIIGGYDLDYCQQLNTQAQQNTILVRVFQRGTDYILCSPAVIESWSHGTPTHYDEIVSSVLWYFHQSLRHDWLPYYESIPHRPQDAPLTPLFFSEGEDGFTWDNHNFTQGELEIRLRNLQRETAGPEIEYAPGVAPSAETHFATQRPIYWNTRAPGVNLPLAPAPGLLP